MSPSNILPIDLEKSCEISKGETVTRGSTRRQSLRFVNVPFRNPFPFSSFWVLLALILALLISTAVPSHGDESHDWPDSSEAIEAADTSWIKPDSTLYKGIKYAGKFHLMVLHFPIAFLLAGSLLQWYQVILKKGGSAVPILLWFGALGAVVTASLGWMYGYDSVYFGEEDIKLLFWHRWLGTGTAVLALIVLSLRNKLGPKGLAIALTFCAGLVAAAAHFGASLTYGPDFFMKF